MVRKWCIVQLYPTEKVLMVQKANILSGKPFQLNPDIYKNVIGLDSDVKRASNHHARKIFESKMASDKDFADEVRNTIKKTAYGAKFDKLERLNSKKMYDRFNQALATPEFQKAGINNKFYSELQKNGYNAIIDVNDTKYSGYKHAVKDPTIFFGDKWHKISSEKVDTVKLTNEEIKNSYKALAPYMAKRLAVGASANVSLSAMRKQRIVNQYYKEHPNSKLTEKEILKYYKYGEVY